MYALCFYTTPVICELQIDCVIRQIISDRLQSGLHISNVLRLHIQLVEYFEHGLTQIIG